jgi:hypothetical protein
MNTRAQRRPSLYSSGQWYTTSPPQRELEAFSELEAGAVEIPGGENAVAAAVAVVVVAKKEEEEEEEEETKGEEVEEEEE